jgi:hypothetical protein
MRDQEIISRAFWRISNPEKNLISQSEFEKQVALRLSKVHSKESSTVEAWTVWAMDQGLRLPYEFVNLNRGMVIITSLLAESGSKLTANKIVRNLVALNPQKVYQRLVRDQKVSHRALVRLGFDELLQALNRKPTPIPVPVLPVSVLYCAELF